MQITDNQILTHNQIVQKAERIAFEIYEQNFEAEGIVFAGIDGMGYHLAKYIFEAFRKICDIPIVFIKISLDKGSPSQGEIILDNPDIPLENKTVIIIDDVLNTGATLAFSLKPFLSVTIKKLQVAVLVDRNHKLFPISADYIGYELSTTINEHVHVIMDQPEFVVYLY